MSHHEDVKKFYEKFRLYTGGSPRFLSANKAKERIEFLREELQEFEQAVAERDIAGQADALVDLVYVVLGTAVSMGLPWQELWDDVHGANMRKVLGQTHRGHAVDVTKPEGWVGPQTTRILMDAGYHPSVVAVTE